jgi:hypothetical protein
MAKVKADQLFCPLPHPLPLQHLSAHLWKHSEALEALETSIRGSRRLEHFCRDFELQKVCYLPLNTFLLRPLHRLMHYKQVLERLCKHHSPNHADFRDCRGEPCACPAHTQRDCPGVPLPSFSQSDGLLYPYLGLPRKMTRHRSSGSLMLGICDVPVILISTAP